MTPEQFKQKAQELYDKHHGHARAQGHVDMDSLLRECLWKLGYEDGLKILDKMKEVWYA